MPNVNIVILAGNLTRDVELRYTPKGAAVASFSIAINRSWKNEAGEKHEEVTFVECTAFSHTAEAIGQYMRKGSPIFINGRLNLNQWDDKKTGEKRQKLTVIADSFQFLSMKDKEEGDAKEVKNKPRPAPKAKEVSKEAPKESSDGDDDVPF